MAPADLIEITSSDSENETEVGPKEKTSVPLRSTPSVHRQLPAWATTSTSNSKSYHGSAEKIPFHGPASGSAERLIDLNNHSPAKPLLYSSSSNTGMPSDQHIDEPKYLSKDWNMGQSRELSSQQSLRMLPPSFRSSPSNSKSKASYENGAGSQIPSSHSIDHSMGTARFDHKDYGGDHLGAQQNDEVVMYGHGRSRVLPPSLMHGKSHTNPMHHASSSDPGHHSTDGELPTENDERVIYQAALQDLSQPKVEASLPDGLLTVPLLKHQKIALAWMVQKETKSVHCLGGILADDQGLGKTVSMIALIQMQRHLQSKPSTNGAQTIKPEALNLDDDDDGVIELEKGKMIAESDDPKKVQEVSTATPVFSKGRPAAGTLVVCPASIVRQWARELDDKVTDSAKLSVLIYHGGSRTKDPIELAKYDVVLTTYAIVTNEVPKQPIVEDDDEDPKNGERFGISSELSGNKKRKKVANAGKKGRKGKMGTNGSIECNSGPLARVGWFRVILDEAQTIKNHRTQVARACSSLRAKRRWCLSGTPIQNTIDDLFSYFRFLKYDPYSAYKSFCSSIKHPISRNAAHGYKKLQAVLKTVMLRRTKGTLLNGEPIINIPPKSVNLSKVEFSTDERAFYSKLEADSRSQFKAYAAAGTVNQNYASILLMLLRLRQACDHPFLVKGYHSPATGEGSLEIAKQLPKEMRINLLNHLEDSMAICGVCSDPPENAVVTMCGHVFCYQCVSEYLTGDDNLCPAPRCKDQIGADVVFSKAILGRSISDELGGYGTSASDAGDSSVVHQDMYSSSKIKAALQVLQTQCIQKCSSITQGVEGCNLASYTEAKISENGECDMNAAAHLTEPKQSQMEGPLKAIVFSQWTSMLDLVETSLNINCIQYRRLDGTMSLPARDRAVKEFNSDPEVVVMLMSLKAGNLGLNMVAACHVILLDIWWNPTTEDQAVDRAHRIGQTRPVTVTRLTIKDTVEDRILALQEEKRKMVAAAFGEDPTGGPGTRLTVEDLRYLFMV